MASILVTVETVAKAFSVLSRSDAGARWRWAQQIVQLRAGQADDKARGKLDAELGAKVAAEVGREKAYSPQWVRAYVNAANKYPAQPTTPAECVAFLDICNGNGSKAKGGKGAPMDKDSALAMLKAAAKAAIKRGASEDECSEALAAAFGGGESEGE